MNMRCAVLALSILLALSSSSWAAPAFENAAPEDTIAFVTVRNVPAFQQHLKAGPLYAVWQEPSVQKFLEKPIESLKQKLTEVEGKAGVNFDETWSLLHGQVAQIVMTDPDNADSMDEVTLVDVGNEGERAMKLMALLVAPSNPAADAPKETPVEETYEGVKLIRMRPLDEKDKGLHFTYGVAGDVLIFGASDEAVKRTVSFLKAPPEKSLATASTYEAVLQRLSPDADLLGFANVALIIALADKRAAQAGGHGALTAQALDALGLTGLGGIGLSVALGPEFDTVQFFAQTTGERKGVVKILTPAPGELHSGAEAPADAASFMTVRFDPAAIFDEIQKILGVIQPAALANLNSKMDSLSKKIGEPFDLREDVLSVFGPRLAAYSRYEQPGQANASQQVVMMLDIVNKAAFRGMWDKLSKIAPEFTAQFQTRDYLGQEMYVQAQEPPQGQRGPAFVVTDRELIYSPDVEALQAHLRRMNAGGPTLRDQPIFEESLSTVPADARVMFSFEDRSRQVEFFLKAIKEGDFDVVAASLRRSQKVANFLDQFDLTLLPDAADITKHLSPSVLCAMVQPDGLLLTLRSRMTPQKAPAEK